MDRPAWLSWLGALTMRVDIQPYWPTQRRNVHSIQCAFQLEWSGADATGVGSNGRTVSKNARVPSDQDRECSAFQPASRGPLISIVLFFLTHASALPDRTRALRT